MHEIALANSVLRSLNPLLDSSKEVKEIIIELGELVGIEGHHLIESLEAISPYKYNIIKKESRISCPCGYEGPAKIIERLHDKVIWVCPWCNEPNEAMKILEGEDIKINKIIYK